MDIDLKKELNSSKHNKSFTVNKTFNKSKGGIGVYSMMD